MPFYLFPETLYKKLQADDDYDSTLDDAYSLYSLSKQQYLGFGLFLQFIPGTNANKARQQFHHQLSYELFYNSGVRKSTHSPVEFIKNLAKSLTIDLVTHFVKSIKEAYQHRNESVLFATVDDLQLMKRLRRTVKGRENPAFSQFTRWGESPTTYIGMSKWGVYDHFSRESSTQNLIAIRASHEKIAKSKALLSHIGLFATDPEAAVEKVRPLYPKRS